MNSATSKVVCDFTILTITVNEQYMCPCVHLWVLFCPLILKFHYIEDFLQNWVSFEMQLKVHKSMYTTYLAISIFFKIYLDFNHYAILGNSNFTRCLWKVKAKISTFERHTRIIWGNIKQNSDIIFKITQVMKSCTQFNYVSSPFNSS